MKPEKMTDEELAQARRDASSGDSAEADWTTEWGAKVFAHIAALEAERDDLKGARDNWRERALTAEGEHRHIAPERDTLRERVTALEHDAKGYDALMLLLGDAFGMASVTGVALVERARRVVKERDAMDRERNEAAVRMEAAESRLAAVRQRAGDEKRLAASLPPREMERLCRALGRVVGEPVEGNLKLTSNSEALHCCGTTTDEHPATCPVKQALASLRARTNIPAPTAPSEAFTHEKGLDAGTFNDVPEQPPCGMCPGCIDENWADGDLCGAAEVRSMEQTDYRAPAAQDVQPTPTPTPEPTTAEAFATLRNAIPCRLDEDEQQALSLLERRMGAVWRTFVEEMAHWPTCPSGNDFSDAGWARCDCHMGQIRALLTDVPPVVTSDEVDKVLSAYVPPASLDEARTFLSALRK